MKHISLITCLFLLTTHSSQSMDLEALNLPKAIKICFLGIINNNIELLRQGLSLKPDINYEIVFSNDNKDSLFLLACLNNNENIIEELLKQENIDIMKGTTTANICPMHWICKQNQPKIMNLLLQKNPQTANVRTKTGTVPLHYAAEYGSKDCIEPLLMINPSSIDKQDYLGGTALHYACNAKKLDCVKILLMNDAHITIKNHHQETPLWLLFNNNDDVNTVYSFFDNNFYNTEKLRDTTDEQGNTQLHLCATVQPRDGNEINFGLWYKRYIDFLISLGIHRETKNNNGKTAANLARDAYNDLNNQYKLKKLSYLAEALEHQKLIMDCLSDSTLSDHITITDDNLLLEPKENSLEFASMRLHGAINYKIPEWAESILKTCPEVATIPNKDGILPLYTAINHGNQECIELLLNASKKNINHQDADGCTPLHKICITKDINSIQKQYNIIKLLLINDACTTIQDNMQTTPLIRMFSYLNRENSFYSFITKNPGFAEQLIQTTDNEHNNQFHLCTQLQAFDDKNFQKYLSFLTSRGLNIHSRNADGKTAADLVRDAYNKLYHQYITTKLPYIRTAFNTQERLMHHFLRFTPSISCANFQTILKQLPFPQELQTYIEYIYYALNIDTIIAKKYKNNHDYYNDCIENKNEIRRNLLAHPERQLLWGT